ncbi:glutathione S-transferase N-terminal domain-containing protein [Rhizobium sp. RU36D]|uniref:glutathione S-transferase family protein n=1 Tax=Rhizobium sp. RU36D TaxID=1907415 RepID=UPI0009D7C4E6|nr:glutathione S-transferase N-terminal domain-containing protein [Rhizobium sp. RU36D]SMC94357.1 GST-like protein [Rhizobium sp. RU36D]
MIDIYTWPTPNGLKISIALEELGLPYRVHSINIEKDEQFAPAFVAINPAAKIPVIVDQDTGTVLTESSAILVYLAEKTGRLLPEGGAARLQVLEWLFWQSASFGPTLGYAHYFLTYHAGAAPFAETRFGADVRRLYETLERRLNGREFVVDVYSIADIAVWPWVSRFARHRISLDDFPETRRWYLVLGNRPAIQRGYRIPHFTAGIPLP